MVKLEFTALLYSNKNYDLSYKLNKYCYKVSMNLVNCINFVELTIKAYQFRPQFIFCDMTSADLSSAQLKLLMDNKACKNTKIVFIGLDNQKDLFDNYWLENSEFICYEDIENYILNCFETVNLNNICADNYTNNTELSESIVQLLYSLGFSPKHTGFNFLREILYNVISNDGIFSSLIGDQYPIIAVKYKTTCSSIERNIRNAITSAFKNYSNQWKNIFLDYRFLTENKRPTNREFICLCVDKIFNEHKQKQFAF